jgi:hypothetical protein
VVEATEEIDVTNEELAEVQRHAPVDEVQEHEPTRVVLSMPMGNLSGKQRIVFRGASSKPMCG